MIIWPNEIAAFIIEAFQIASEQHQASVVFFTLALWLIAVVVAAAALAGAVWTIYCVTRGCWAWAKEGRS